MVTWQADSPSLMQGWVPLTVEFVTVAALVYVSAGRRWRWSTAELGAAVVVGLAVVLAARWTLQSSGLSGEVAPWTVWGWTFATGFAVTVTVVGWRRATGWWRHAAAFASAFCLLSTGLAVNGWIGYLPTAAVAWDSLTGRPLTHEIDWSSAAAMRGRGDPPQNGQLVAVDTGNRASGFRHRTEWVYLPPQWFRGAGTSLSVVVMIGGEFTTAVDWVRAGQAAVTADEYARTHNGNAPVLVFVDPNGAFTNDTECVNGSRGQAADHVTKDVVPAIVSRLGVSADPRRWSIAGFSSGGTCAVDLAVMHPQLFGSFVDIAGDERPSAGTQAQTIQRLFAGDRQAWASFDPATVITRHGPYTGTAGMFIVPTSSRPDTVAAQRLCGIAAAQGVRCSVTALRGRHTWPFAAAAFETALPWLAARGDAAVSPPGESAN